MQTITPPLQSSFFVFLFEYAVVWAPEVQHLALYIWGIIISIGSHDFSTLAALPFSASFYLNLQHILVAATNTGKWVGLFINRLPRKVGCGLFQEQLIIILPEILFLFF